MKAVDKHDIAIFLFIMGGLSGSAIIVYILAQYTIFELALLVALLNFSLFTWLYFKMRN